MLQAGSCDRESRTPDQRIDGAQSVKATLASAAPHAAAVLALQRVIGNAGVIRVLRASRGVSRQPYDDELRTLLGQAPFQGDADAATALGGLQTRAFTR